MNYALERVVYDLKPQLDKYGIEVDIKRGLLIRDRTVTRMKHSTSDAAHRRVLLEAVKEAKDKRKARLQAKQTSLLTI